LHGTTVSILTPRTQSAQPSDRSPANLSTVLHFDRAWSLPMGPGNLEPDRDRLHPISTVARNAAKVTFLDDEDVDGHPCRVIRIDYPESEHVSGSFTTLAIGDDGFVRRYRQAFVFGSARTIDTSEYSGVVLADDLPDQVFEPWIPEHYRHVHCAADGDTSETLQEGGEARVAQQPQQDGTATPDIGDAAPNIVLTMADGDSLSLSDLRGAPVLIDFWGTWCGPCIIALPSIQKLSEDFGPRGLRVVGVSVNERGDADPARFLEVRDVTYPTAIKGEDAAAAMGVQGYPHVFLIDADGVLRGSWLGYSSEKSEEIRKAIENALEDPSDDPC
jgi:thiol-disulfide isomerase/thioredoxin